MKEVVNKEGSVKSKNGEKFIIILQHKVRTNEEETTQQKGKKRILMRERGRQRHPDK